MSQSAKTNLTIISLICGIALSILGFVQAYAVIPYRQDEQDKAIRILQDEAKSNREILIRIEERVKQLQGAK